MASNNYVEQLNLYMQKHNAKVTYEDVEATGPDHIRTFVMRVVVNGVPYPDGAGKNKKEAKQNAAKNALERLLQEPEDSRMNVSEALGASVDHTPTRDCVSWLNLYGQRLRLSVDYIHSTQQKANNPEQFCCRCKVGDIEYPEGTGTNKKEAKQAAARIAFDMLSSPNTRMSYETTAATPHSVSQVMDGIMNMSIASADESAVNMNYIGRLNEYCQVTSVQWALVEDQRTGPPNQQRFFFKAVIGGKEYPLGEGGNKQEARKNAARLAWNDIHQQAEGWSSSSVWTPAGSSTPVRSGETTEPRLPAMSSPGSSIVFKDTPLTPQAKVPDVKPKRVLAANFADVVPKKPTKQEPKGNGKTKEEKQNITSFQSDFDSIERIGKGAFGHVYKARSKLLKKDFAVKIVKFRDEKPLAEVKTLIDLIHENIVRYFHCWLQDTLYQPDGPLDATSSSTESVAPKYLYIQMELCGMGTLRKCIDEKNGLNKKPSEDSNRREWSLDIARQMISGVEYFHSKLFIHRDLKPANVMFGESGQVKIGDFGLVTEMIEDDSENERERAMFKGTRTYMAPEQKNNYVCECKTDIFALGLIFFELYWSISTIHERKEIWAGVRQQRFPQGFTAFFHPESEIIKRMLSQTPTDRPEAKAVKKLLKKLYKELYEDETVSRERKTC